MILIYLVGDMEIGRMKKRLLALTAGLLAGASAQAHVLWIEPGASGALRLHYGEPEVRVLEPSPGKLDAIEPVRAEAARGGSPLVWQRRADAIALSAGAGAVGDAFVEARLGAAGDGTPRHYYARHAAWPLRSAAPATALDIVPTAEPGRFAVHYRGAPLTRATLKVIAPSLWLQVHDIDERGLVRIATPWRGLYVLEVELREADAVHRATLSFNRLDGAAFDDPIPAQYRAE